MTRYKGYVIKRTATGEYDIYLRGQKVAHGAPLSGAKFWVDHYGKANPAKASAKSLTRARAAVSRKKTAILKSVKSLLKKVNPSAAITGASVVKLKGGALKITPIKANISVRKTKKLVKGGGGTGFWTGKPGASKLHKIKPAKRRRK